MNLSPKGVEEAREAGKVLKREGFDFKLAYTSYLTRAIKTLWLILEEMDLMYIPERKTWKLNEKHYGMLQGLNKTDTTEKYGEDQVLLWRRSYDAPPPPVPEDHEMNARFDRRYSGLDDKDIPRTESLKQVVDRLTPYWETIIGPSLKENKEILIAAHGNSLRALVKYLKGMSEEEIINFNIPTAVPYVLEFDDDMNLQKDYFLGDAGEIEKMMKKVADQTKKK